jgi:tetratricopeptide (TPR) repeat protein
LAANKLKFGWSRLLLVPWFSVQFRYVALWVVKHRGGLLALLAFIALLALAALFFFAIVLSIFAPEGNSTFDGVVSWLWDHLSAASLLKAVAALALLWLLVSALKSRRQMFIAAFDDFTGDPSMKEFVSGLPRILLNELGAIGKLYGDVNETRAASAADSGSGPAPMPATISVQDAGQTLQTAVTADSKVKLWGIEIPIGAMLSLFGRATQGPQLSGSIYKQNGEVALIARLEGAGYPSMDWRVVPADLPDDTAIDSSGRLSQMVEQLAYRIFTDLVSTGASRWQAVYAFSQGLKHLRITSRTETDKFWHLRQAEASFLEAVSEDSKFSTCYYNLGVVYGLLKQPDSASSAYAKAIEQNPGFAPAYYAVALNRWNAADAAEQDAKPNLWGECLGYCDQALTLDKDYARAWNLRGLAIRKIEGDAGLRESVKSRAMAAAIAWKSYCRSQMDPHPDPEPLDIAFNCMRNLAVGEGSLGSWRAPAIYRQGLFLKPMDADLHYEFGLMLDDRKRYNEAARQFEAAAHIGGKSLYWAWLAKAQANGGVSQDAIKASLWQALLGSVSDTEISSDVLKRVNEACAEKKDLDQFVADVKEARRIARELDFPAGQIIDQQSLKSYLEKLEGLLPADEANNWRFDAVIQAIKLQSTDLEQQERIRQMAETLVRKKSLYGYVALAFRSRGKVGDLAVAFFHAEYAVTLDPLNDWTHSVLGDIFWALGDYQRAEAEYNACLDLAPTESSTLSGIANTYWNRGVDVFNPEQRRSMFNRVIDSFGRVLRITENQTLARDTKDCGASQMTDRGRVHFWLGRFHQELLNYDTAILELRKARGLGFNPSESLLHLGSVYLEAKAYDKVEETLRPAFEEVVKSLRALKLAQRRAKIQEAARIEGEDIPVRQRLAYMYLHCALAGAERRADVRRILPLAGKGFYHSHQLKTSERRTAEGLYYEILGLLALRAGNLEKALENLERSVALAFECRCFLRLAEAYLTQAQSDDKKWKLDVKAARDCCDLADSANLRRGYTVQISALRKRIEELEQEKKSAGAKSAPAAQS